nr:hypothetical protein [Tanacetum cinerariifolium]
MNSPSQGSLIDDKSVSSESNGFVTQPEFGTQRTVNVAGTKEKVRSQVVHKFGIQCFNCKEYGHFAKECRKLKRVKDSVYHKDKMLLCKQTEQGVPLQAEQYDWLADTDEEVDEQEREAHYSYMAKIQEVPNAESGIDSEPAEQPEFSDIYDVILHDCVSKDVMCSYLQSLSDLDALAELQYLKAQMQDKNIAISELKKLIENDKEKYVDTKFDRQSVVQQPNAQRILKPSVLGKPTPFSNSLKRKYFPKTRSVLKTNVSEGLSKPVTAQTLPQTAKKAGSNSSDGGNTRDGVKITGGVIGFGGGIEFSKKSEEMFLGVAGK